MTDAVNPKNILLKFSEYLLVRVFLFSLQYSNSKYVVIENPTSRNFRNKDFISLRKFDYLKFYWHYKNFCWEKEIEQNEI